MGTIFRWIKKSYSPKIFARFRDFFTFIEQESRVRFLWKNSNLNLNLISNLINFGFLNQIETKTKLDKCHLYEYRVYNNLVFQTILFINHGFTQAFNDFHFLIDHILKF